jgi:N-acetyl-gamma-glutamyl-phosphate reductase
VEANENLSPYSIGRTHRHVAEMEQELALLDARAGGWQLIFSPHLLPVNRGILSTLYVTLPHQVTEDGLRALYSDAYTAEPFTFLLPAGQVATLAHTVYTNYCAIGLTPIPESRTLIVTVSIDNLVKGASGQAIQNMNIRYGLDERMGLV